MPRCLTAAVLLGLLISFVVPAFASRAELDGRGLPRLLALDSSSILLFPGSAAQFGRSALVDISSYSYSPIYVDYVSNETVTALVAPITTTSDRLIMGLTGRDLVFGYVLDGATHNLVLSHRSGWGASLGISDVYSESERARDITFRTRQEYEASTVEVSRRDVRLTLGWARTNASQRLFELGLTGDMVHAQQSISQTNQTVDTTLFSYAEWKSEPGFGFDVRVRTLSPRSGFQGMVRFAYEDLQPEVVAGPPTTSIRRYALTELGWRIPLKELEDLQIGVVLEWSHDTFSGQSGSQGYFSTVQESTDNTRYFGEIFASGERSIVKQLRARAGVHGSAYFQKDENLSTTQELNGTLVERFRRSQGAIQQPTVYLGVGWDWKAFSLDGRLNENISLDNPFLQWSVGYTW